MLYTASLSNTLRPRSRHVCELVVNDSEEERNDSCETDSVHS